MDVSSSLFSTLKYALANVSEDKFFIPSLKFSMVGFMNIGSPISNVMKFNVAAPTSTFGDTLDTFI